MKKNEVVGYPGRRRGSQRHAAGENLRVLHEVMPTVDDDAWSSTSDRTIIDQACTRMKFDQFNGCR